MDRISFTVVLTTAAQTIITASNILSAGPDVLTGVIGRAALDAHLPARRRPRIKARTRNNAPSTYGPTVGQPPNRPARPQRTVQRSTQRCCPPAGHTITDRVRPLIIRNDVS